MGQQVIGKYPIDFNLLKDDNSLLVLLPRDAKILSVGFTPISDGVNIKDTLCIWAMSETLSPEEPHYLVLALTGGTFTNSCGRLNFIGTAISSTHFVAHVFERVSAYY